VRPCQRLQRHSTSELLIAREIDDPHATAADLLFDLVGADAHAAAKFVEFGDFRGVYNRGCFEKTCSRIMRTHERFRFAHQCFVTVGVNGEPFPPFFNWLFEHAMEQHLETLPLLACHRDRSAPSCGSPSTARFSQARAIAH